MASKPAFFQTPTQFTPLTPSEQRLTWLQQQRATRRLTNDEWREVTRCEHNIYCMGRKG